MKTVLDILRGIVIGLANVIPGVSGGTMMVSMGIYDTIIDCINNLFRKFKESLRTLWPYLLGMAIAILAGSLLLKEAFDNYPLPTNALFIGLILGSLPIIWAQIKGEKINAAHVLIFLVFAAVVIVPKVIANQGYGAKQAADTDLLHLLLYFVLGVIASASMVVPGISGSMMLKIFGYYETIVTDTLGGTVKEVLAGNLANLGHALLVLLPFGIGIVVGILGVAKLIGWLLKRWKGYTYSAILGMVAASPVVILMDKSNWLMEEAATGNLVPRYAAFPTGIVIVSLVMLVLGFFVALKLGGEPEKDTAK
ncbi:MAG: DUF368 domain-containing protein [Clostridia bacterium]|nr:DUF368 domain-containing protein [Clostridia bacterium]